VEKEPEPILEIPATQVKKEILLYKASARDSKSSSSSFDNGSEKEIKVYVEQEVQKIQSTRSPILTPKSSSVGSPLSSRQMMDFMDANIIINDQSPQVEENTLTIKG